MRTSRIRKMAADAAALRRESPASRTLCSFFEFACGASGHLLGVNPFNQPGVESYKKNMFVLLGKPEYEAKREELQKRLE